MLYLFFTLFAYLERLGKLAGLFHTDPGCCTAGRFRAKLSQHKDDKCRGRFFLRWLRRGIKGQRGNL